MILSTKTSNVSSISTLTVIKEVSEVLYASSIIISPAIVAVAKLPSNALPVMIVGCASYHSLEPISSHVKPSIFSNKAFEVFTLLSALTVTAAILPKVPYSDFGTGLPSTVSKSVEAGTTTSNLSHAFALLEFPLERNTPKDVAAVLNQYVPLAAGDVGSSDVNANCAVSISALKI